MSSTTDSENSPPRSWRVRLCRLLWMPLRFFWIGVVFSVCLGSIPSIFFLGAGTQPKDLLIVSWWNSLIVPHFLTAASLLVGVILLTVISWLGSREEKQKASSPSQHERSNVLDMLRKAYAEEQASSLPNAIKPIDLNLHERFDLSLPLRQEGQTERSLAPGTTIIDVYDRAGRGLLIAGEPGGGKTTLLYELARTLLDRAEHDEKLPLPVVLNLSSWGLKRRSLEEWIPVALEQRHNLSRRFWQRWVKEERLLLLLDGLDEVEESARSACIEAINTYHAEHVTPLVTCSRLQEYLAQAQRLTLQSAVVVQPLTLDHIRAYLKQAGRSLAAVRRVVENNAVLQHLLTTPLMLIMVVLIYQGKMVKDVQVLGTVDEQRNRVFRLYRQKMLFTSEKIRRCSPEQMQHWLEWLAKQMHQHSLSILYLEQLQPDWLTTSWAQRLYAWLGIRLPGAIIGALVAIIVRVLFSGSAEGSNTLLYGLVGGCIGGLLSKKQGSSQRAGQHHQDNGFFRRFIIALLLGLLVGMSGWLSNYAFVPFDLGFDFFDIGSGFGVFLFTLLLMTNTRENRDVVVSYGTTTARRSFWKALLARKELRYGLLIGGFYGLSVGLSDVLEYAYIGVLPEGLGVGVSAFLRYGLSIGLSGVLIAFLLIQRSPLIEATEIVVWSWKSLWSSLTSGKHLRNVLLVALCVLIAVGLNNGIIQGLTTIYRGMGPMKSWSDLLYVLYVVLRSGLAYGLAFSPIIAGAYWLLIGLFQGISSDHLQEKQRTAPNLGIQRSLRNGLLLGALSGGICAFMGAFIAEKSSELTPFYYAYGTYLDMHVQNIWFVTGIAGALLFGILMGGLPWWRHWVLRVLLWREGAICWRYVLVLDEAAQRILLRKEGGGYRFIHDLFRDYMASVDVATASASQITLTSP